jgi:hypothetical protein
MKWFSVKTNPAAIYLPQFISQEEEMLLYRSLKHAVRKSDNRGKASGSVDTEKGEKAYVRRDQEATLELLKSDASAGSKLLAAIREAQAEARDENPNRLRTWEGGKKKYREAAWSTWWKRVAKLPTIRRREAVTAFERSNISKRTYGNKVKSSVIGNSGRDANNPWARRSNWNTDFPYDYDRVVPILQRIDRAFKIALPQRYAIQQEYVNRIPKEFRIADTVFTTVTVNANFQTALHRDDGNLRQGFSNLLVLCNGKRYEGGHLILPEFGAEVAMKPRDLLFVQNDEYLHSNTPITHRDRDATRMSLVCYVRESFLFSGTASYENLRRDFVGHQQRLEEHEKVRARRWESKAWYEYLRKNLRAKHGESLLVVARKAKLLNAELLYLTNKWESDPLFDQTRYQYLAELAPPSRLERVGLEAVFSALHLKTARQDQVPEKGKKKPTSDDGAVLVDSLFLSDIDGERWGISHTTSESGAARFNNNRFNVQAVAPIQSIPREIEKLSRDAYEWIKRHWDEGRSVWLIAAPTGIPEAPQRMAFTTISPKDRKLKTVAGQLKRTRQAFIDSASSLADRYFPNIPSRTAELYDLGWRRAEVREGTFANEGQPHKCEAIELTYQSERAYLREHLAHYVRRAKALNNEDYQQRYELVGTYRSLSKPVPIPKLHQPWAWTANKHSLTIQQDDKSYTLACSQAVRSWRSPSLSALIFGARTPNAAVRVWSHRTSSHARTGQITATDGSAFWLFQSISALGYIGADEVHSYAAAGSKKKITRPSLVRHAQRQNPIAPLNGKLLKRIQRLPTNSISVIPETQKTREEAIENFQIAVPSYGRSGMIEHFTLKMLERYKVDPKRVTIFVADEATKRLWAEKGKRGKPQIYTDETLENKREPALYRERLKNNPYGKRIVVGVKNIGSQRNWIQNYYPEGTHLISLDDDLVQISELRNGKYVEIGGAKAFHRLISQGFSECHSTGSHLWGLYASANEDFQSTALESREISHNNNYIIASFYGKIVRHDPTLEVESVNHAEDYERSLRFFARDGLVVRFNRYTMSKGTEYFGKGGLEQERKKEHTTVRRAPYEDSIKRVAALFPTLCSAYKKGGKVNPKTGKRPKKFPYGRWEIRLKRRREA